MKKLLVLACALTALITKAQQLNQLVPFENVEKPKEMNFKQIEKVPFRTFGEDWYNTHNDLAQLFLIDGDVNNSPVYALPLFPDSTIYWGISQVSNDPVSAWIHGAGDVINPTRTTSEWVDQWATVVIDSIDIWKSYVRNTSNSIVDTLFVDILNSQNASSYFDFNSNNTVDVGEFPHQPLVYDQAKNELIPQMVRRRDTILLTVDDTSANIASLAYDVNDTVQPDSRYGVYITFKPGFTWTANNDTLDKYNTFSLISREQEKDAYPQQLWSNVSGFGSYILPQDVRYNTSSIFNGFIVPTFAYADSWVFEHHYIWYKLTTNEVGIKEINDGVSKIGNYPNPASAQTKVNFELNRRTEVLMKVTDLTGKVIDSFNLGEYAKGQHSYDLDLAKYTTGNYLLVVNGSSKVLTVLK